MSTTDFTSARPASWKCVIAIAAYPCFSASTALRIRLRAMRNSVTACVVVAGGVVVWKVASNCGSRMLFRCASTFAMYGAMCTLSVAP